MSSKHEAPSLQPQLLTSCKMWSDGWTWDLIWQMLEDWSRECHEEGQDVCHEDIRHPYHKSAGQKRETTFKLIFVTLSILPFKSLMDSIISCN